MAIELQIDLTLGNFKLSTDLLLPDRGITGIFGESGSGKTSLARTIAGLEPSASGLVRFRETIWQDSKQKVFIPTHERRVGFVFQKSVLFSHLSVRDNLLFGYATRTVAVDAVDIDHLVDLFNLTHLLDRDPRTLSGGETQRVAIGQAVLSHPQLLIMDEPMTGLDHRRRRDAVLYLEKLDHLLNIPILYITHSIRELERLVSHLVVLEDGAAQEITDISNHIRALKQEGF